ncbi:MAG: N-6 DNA methylase [Ilumatobacteraceae bacterium]
MAVSQRKRLGAWYTPAALVDAVVAEVARGVFSERAPVSVLDPACGDGRFLAAVAEALASRGIAATLTGVDIDPDAAVFRPSRLQGEWICADARTIDWRDRRFDIIVGNPPFLNQLSSATSRGGRSVFGGGPYADVAAEFLALSMKLASPGGRVGLVLPQSLLAARDAGAIRADVASRGALRWMWWSPTSMFDAEVHCWAGVWDVGAAQRPEVRRVFGDSFVTIPPAAWPDGAAGSWSGLIADVARPAVPAGHATLGSIAMFKVDFRDQYYGLVGAVGDGGEGSPLITSGLIEPGRCLWGSRPTRFAKQRFAAPRVDLAMLSPKMRQWSAQRLVPKILIANQTRVIEAVHDPLGMWLPSVPVITCIAADADRVLDVLGSTAATEWVRYHAAGSGLSADAVRLNPRLLASIPLPDARSATAP